MVIAAVALGAPGRVSDGWQEFKEGGGAGSGAERLGSVAGESRYQLWSAAVRENGTKPLTGTGSGTFEFWWARDGDTTESVRDTHSLYLQTLGELGIVGLLCSPPSCSRSWPAGAAGCWPPAAGQVPVRRGAGRGSRLLHHRGLRLDVADPGAARWRCCCSARAPGSARRAGGRGGCGRGRRVAAAHCASPSSSPLAAIVAIAIPLASTSLVRQSEADARDGDLTAALSAAGAPRTSSPTPLARACSRRWCSSPGRSGRRREAARAATERESTNWRTWLVLSRIEAERGRADAAVRDYQEARSLNPRSELFAR